VVGFLWRVVGQGAKTSFLSMLGRVLSSVG
jgi:hypothetical protein